MMCHTEPQYWVKSCSVSSLMIWMLQQGSNLSKFADGTKLGVMADTLEGCAARDQSQVKPNPTWKRNYSPQETKCVYCLLKMPYDQHMPEAVEPYISLMISSGETL